MLYQYVVYTAKGAVDGSVIPAKHGGHKNNYDKFATLEQARAEQVRRGGVVQLVPCVHQSVIDLAERVGVAVDVLAVDVWRVCMWLQMQGNNHDEGLPDDLPGYVLALDDVDGVLSGILFKSKDGQWFVNRRKSHYNPFESVGEVWSWARQWCVVFGGVDGEAVLDIVATIEAEIDRVLNPPVKRGHDRLHYEEVDTFTIAHRWAVHKLLAEHYFSKVLGSRGMGSIYASLSSLHRGEAWVYHAELVWRTTGEPEPRRTKAEFREAVWDWKKAGDYLSGDLVIFDKAYAEAIVSAEGLDLVADVDNLPKMGRMPAKRMSVPELLSEVVRLAGVELPPDSFEYEDRELLYESIRKVLSNMRSEHIV